MKFSTSFVVWALATTACVAKQTARERRSERRKNKRRLSLSYLVNHDVKDDETDEVQGRASIAFGDEPIIGVYFQPIYQNSELNTGVYQAPREIPGTPNATDVPQEQEQTPEPTTASPTPVPTQKIHTHKHNTPGSGQMRNGTGGGSGVPKQTTGTGGVAKKTTGTGGVAQKTGTGGGAKRTGGGGGAKRGTGGGQQMMNGPRGGNGLNRNGGGNGTGTYRKRYVRRFSKGGNPANRNGNRNGSGTAGKTGSKEGSKDGTKSGSKSKTGGSGGLPTGGGQKTVGGECRQLCADIPYSTQSYRTPVCDATSVLDWMNIAGDNCCCSGGISYLKLQFDTIWYENSLLAGSFYIDKTIETTTETTIDTVATPVDTTGSSIDTTVDIASEPVAARRNRNGYKRRNRPSSRMDGTVDNIFIVDCDDECLTNPVSNRPCSTVRDIQDRIQTGTEICFLQVDDSGLPRFDWGFPDILNVVFESTIQEIFNVAIDTTCGVPAVSPWAAVGFPSGMQPIASPINSLQSQALGFNLPIFLFKGGMSTGSYTAAANNPFQQAGYQLDLEQCGCDCSDYPPTEAPSENLRDFDVTDTLPPTMDFSCQPSSDTGDTGRDMDIPGSDDPDEITEPPTIILRVSEPIGAIGTDEKDLETAAPTVVFDIPSPIAPPVADTITTSWPSRNPTSSPTEVPTIRPTFQPTFNPTGDPTSKPTASPTSWPTTKPTASPTAKPTALPTGSPSAIPTCTDSPDGSMAHIEATVTIPQPNTCGSGTRSIYDYVCSVANFSNFCRIIERAGLVELMDGIDGTTPFLTVFAPTNKGCKSSGLSLAQINSMSTDHLKQIVLTHGTPWKVTAEGLQCDAMLPTLDGSFLSHSTKCFEQTHAKAQVGFFNSEGDYPMILSPNNIELCNGYVQPVNNMLRVVNF
eukprot:CAMPEP_0116137144 /NCGR_PEP_ID=MMETSP0329-20121206/12100_1 /TAXON_ID=697910 /ORGANISM="Pseudo-nitzschia arenysensis, Strain B593" /LENGTH=914 /DNA_ID=CAMNT_0003632057 /DNA_START=75 /DNA_END=2819 /DNA_ORIENTATION=+